MITDLSALAAFLEKTVADFTDLAVVGISGGVDSSVVASICVRALGSANVHLVSMPYDEIDTETFNARSTTLAEHLKAHHHTVPIKTASEPVEQAIGKIFPDQKLDQLTLANVRPRVRMNVLYTLSGELGFKTGQRVRVMGTGHLSEDLIGYDTKGGDALCDIFILSDLVKSEVYQLAEFYDVDEVIRKAAPSAGLYPGQTDQDELGYSYDELEPPTLALYNVIQRGVPLEKITATLKDFERLDPQTVRFVIERYKIHGHKHRAPATVDSRNPNWFR